MKAARLAFMASAVILTLTLVAPSLALALSTVDYSATIGVTVTCPVPADQYRKTLLIENPYGNTTNIGYCVAVQTPQCQPSIGSAGTTVLQPGAVDFYTDGNAPTEAVCLIASGVSTPDVIRVGK